MTYMTKEQWNRTMDDWYRINGMLKQGKTFSEIGEACFYGLDESVLRDFYYKYKNPENP